MRQRAIIIVVAVFLGLTAAFMVTNYANQAKEAALEQTETVRILVAADELPVGKTLEELRDLKLVEDREVPKGFVAEGAIRPGTKMGDKVLAVGLSTGEQLTAGRFKEPADAGLANVTPDDMVSVAIPINNMKAAGNLVKVGDYVNVVGTIEVELPDGKNQKMTKTFLQKIQVLAVNSVLENQEDKKSSVSGLTSASSSNKSSQTERTVTLAMSQADSEKLVFMQEEGSIWLTLLPSSKVATVTTAGQVVETALGIAND
jgi:pilus assembly protein CpaB